MQAKFILFFLVTSIGFSQNTEWTYLFDGKTFDGWHQYNSDEIGSQWSINNGELIFTNNKETKILKYNSAYFDFRKKVFVSLS